MKQLDAGELPLSKIFSSDYDFVIPEYQRPYAWGTEQALMLLDDLEDALATRDQDEPYFLGSAVLVKERGEPRAEVIDGQQRLTTLTLLFAVLRDITDNAKLSRELEDFIQEPGKIVAGTEPKPRLTLRSRDSEFFQKYVQEPGNIEKLLAVPDSALKTDSQRAIRDNAEALTERLRQWPDVERQRLATMAGIRTYLVVVSTPDLASAHRIFSVMNARGLDLSAADIFKAKVIGEIADPHKSSYADKWEDAEQDLSRDGFADLFLHIRMIFGKTRAQRELLKEFPEQVLDRYLPSRATEFVDDVLIPYADSYRRLVKQDFASGATAVNARINAWLKRLAQLDNTHWRPPALWALRHYSDDPEWLDAFLRKLERLAASMLIRRIYTTPRASRYADLLRQLERGEGLDAPAFELSADERFETREQLSGDIYLVKRVVRYVLLRLDETLSESSGATYDYDVITLEHVLPQTPSAESEWCVAFTETEREYWTHRLANLVLLNRRKNSVAQNYGFAHKKRSYFTGKTGVSTFALTSQVLNTSRWTPAVLNQRQGELTKALFDEWSL